MMAGLTAALSNTGVLTISGTTGNDTITLREISNQISVDTITTKYSATQVKSIVINANGGNDSININSAATRGQQALTAPVTINSGNGNDAAVLGDGRTAYFSSLGHTLSAPVSGVVKLDNQALTWFDTNIQTSGLRTLAKTDFNDGSLSRTDMIGIFRQAETYGAMTATVLADLRAIVKNSSLFPSLNYVQVLSSDIANGNTANAHYQGAALGNLGVGTSAANLEKLVDKWFLGTDHPTGISDWGPTYAYRPVSGALFPHAPTYTDVVQGGCGDCYLLSALGETALRNPSAITNMFVNNGDGTFTVRFYNGNQAQYVTVDSQLPTDSSGRLVFDGMGSLASSSSNVLWVAMAEKAYAEMNEMGWVRAGLPGSGQNSYIGISGGYVNVPLAQINGVAASYANTSTTSFSTFAATFNAGKLIDLGSKGNPTLGTIVGGHAYAVVSVNTTNQTVTVFNPWGINNGSQYPGLVTLTWAQLQANFSEWDHT
jgi:hypothetical protein